MLPEKSTISTLRGGRGVPLSSAPSLRGQVHLVQLMRRPFGPASGWELHPCRPASHPLPTKHHLETELLISTSVSLHMQALHIGIDSEAVFQPSTSMRE
jgi:hypothetical protein